MSLDQVTVKSRRTISPELKEKMAQGRRKAAEARKAKANAKEFHRKRRALPLAPKENAAPKPDEPQEFLGLSLTDCCADCTPQRCAIGGSLVFNNGGTTTLEGKCCHPNKGGLSPIHQTKPVIVERYHRAVKYLEHVEVERKKR